MYLCCDKWFLRGLLRVNYLMCKKLFSNKVELNCHSSATLLLIVVIKALSTVRRLLADFVTWRDNHMRSYVCVMLLFL